MKHRVPEEEKYKYNCFASNTIWGRSTKHPKFVPPDSKFHVIETPALTTQPSVTSSCLSCVFEQDFYLSMRLGQSS